MLSELAPLICLKPFLVKRTSQPDDVALSTQETTMGEGAPSDVSSLVPVNGLLLEEKWTFNFKMNKSIKNVSCLTFPYHSGLGHTMVWL